MNDKSLKSISVLLDRPLIYINPDTEEITLYKYNFKAQDWPETLDPLKIMNSILNWNLYPPIDLEDHEKIKNDLMKITS